MMGLRIGTIWEFFSFPQKKGISSESFITDCFCFLAGVLGMVLGQTTKGLPESGNPLILWWRRRDLNPRPPPCEGDALPAELLPHNGKLNAGNEQ